MFDMTDSGVSPYGRVCRRPLGVTILAALEIIWSIFMLIAAIGMFAAAGFLAIDGVPPELMDMVSPDVLQGLPMTWAVMGIMILIFAIIGFAIAWGFLKGRNWSRVLLMIFLILSIISSILGAIMYGSMTTGTLVSLGISIVIPVIILWYLALNHVSNWFHCYDRR
ncbi:hypothetical protein A3207_03325 [Candidatus Methanomassiliicoccus intestinalis]|jgi:hypothetical protein|uniref:DUF2127 domain-containing protein n=3 Tax=Candidatus Methanomassiliicoccus intestinalis TaxID=1406512 RepID=R9TAZ6_METII|nr:hypothetical protein [Candidatus Methanomassiliicoccus intestinalis]AGN26866.1 hypothetical protein MMINT_15570 [Candidatus Methanomassiliicoccus intestinalis Issoire-Mx1]TQS82984.1 MAG: hypothetical protein A3207_03325 [Candidatus Methanomassiliicoccus intestinalis]TQS83839.1 MAG: hypothetical protein A3206_03160 [Candidatus Methanomassiliicoccus intestinalis]